MSAKSNNLTIRTELNAALLLLRDVDDKFRDILEAPLSETDPIPKTYIDRLNRPEVISAIKRLQNFTTSPSWFTVCRPLLVDPYKDQTKQIQRLKKYGCSGALIDLLFYQKYRPRYDMRFLPQVGLYSPRYQDETIKVTHLNQLVKLGRGIISGDFYIPVLRYQEEGQDAFYFRKSTLVSYCGTFYYVQDNSEVYLHGQTIMVAENKLMAAFSLGMTIEELNRLGGESYYFMIMDHNLQSKLPNSFMEFLNQVKDDFRRFFPRKRAPEYFYAFEDFLDQSLCRLARERNVELVMLTDMIGKTGYVSEILDVRKRSESFHHLIFPPVFGELPILRGSPYIVYPYDTVREALTSGDSRRLELVKQVGRVRYGSKSVDGTIHYQPLDLTLTSADEEFPLLIRGFITVTNLDRQIDSILEYLSTITLEDRVVVQLDRVYSNEIMRRFLVVLLDSWMNLTQLKIVIGTGPSKRRLYNLDLQNKKLYSPYSWGVIPDESEELSLIDKIVLGDKPWEVVYPISPSQLMLNRHSNLNYLSSLLRDYPTIYQIMNNSTFDLSKIKGVYPQITQLLGVTLEERQQLTEIFPNTYVENDSTKLFF
jgi:hypothetical protein